MSNEEVTQVTPELIDSGHALTALVRGEIDIQIATAKKYPREISKVKEDVLQLATSDPETAAECWYALPRDGKVIEGPSVRFAEILAASYGNLRVQTRVIGIDQFYVTVEGSCADLEKNVAASCEVKRRITKKGGVRFSDDMIIVTANAASAIAFRNAVYKVVPRALVKGVLDKINQVAAGDEKTFKAKVFAALEWFKSRGISTAQILALDGIKVRAVDDLKAEHLRILGGIVTAIREETTTIEEVFASSNQKPAGISAGSHSFGRKPEPPPPDQEPEPEKAEVKEAPKPEPKPQAPKRSVPAF